MPRIFDAASNHWVQAPGLTHSEELGWTSGLSPDAGTDLSGIYYPKFLGKGTILTRDVSQMPLASNSAQTATWLNDNALLQWGDRTVLNRTAYSIPMYVVDSSVPGTYRCKVRIRAGGYAASYYTIMEGMVPIPFWAKQANGGDAALSVYDRATGIMREYFNGSKQSDGSWSFANGGYYIAKRGLTDLALTNYPMRLQRGSNAVVKMLNPIGQIGIAEARTGVVNHALQFTSSNCRMDLTASTLKPGGDRNNINDYTAKIGAYSWPAQMGDGFAIDQNAHCEGQWFRLPGELDPDDPFYNFKPFTRLLIRAAQKYGGYSTDKNLWVHAFNVEPGTTEQHYFGKDPWAVGGELEMKYGTLKVDDFPWRLTEWAPVDWGKTEWEARMAAGPHPMF